MSNTNLNEVDVIKVRLRKILNTMDLPSKRCVLNSEVEEGNLRWLLRNIQIHNGKHPNFLEAKDLIIKLLVDNYLK